jgi:hypothetical protein
MGMAEMVVESMTARTAPSKQHWIGVPKLLLLPISVIFTGTILNA